jgi:hypothetical protein
MTTHSYTLQTGFTVEDMCLFAGEAWGPLGLCIVSKWCEFNARYFDGALKPIPLVTTNAMPFGKRLAFCSHGNADTGGRTITLNIPKDHDSLVADNNTLLHEMVHQFLVERGEYSKPRRRTMAPRDHAADSPDFRQDHMGGTLHRRPL